MTREEMLTRMIHLYGFEHEAVIQFAELMERDGVTDDVLETLVLAHEAHPVVTDEEEWD